MIRLGLTGSIGMGKTTAAQLFAEEGVPVYDSDATVHGLYAKGGAAVAHVEAAFPGVGVDGAVDRGRLGTHVTHDPEAMARLEAIVHPMVAAGREAFLARAADAPVVVFDIPLLFETGREADVDAIAVVSTTPEIQRQRVLVRPGMTEARLAALLARQTPDAEKRARADFVLDSGRGIEPAREQIRAILREVTAPGWARKPRPSTSSG